MPPELLLHTVDYLPPSDLLRLRLVNKQLRAVAENAFARFCLEEVIFPLTSSGMRLLVCFARSPLAQHVKVLLLKIDGEHTRDEITKVHNQAYLNEALALLRKRHDVLSVGIKYDPTGTRISEHSSPEAKAAVVGNIRDALGNFLLPAVAASNIAIATLFLDVHGDCLLEYGITASDHMLRWLDENCVVSAAETYDILIRYNHAKDDDTIPDNIFFSRGSSLSITGYDTDRHTDTLPFLLTANFSSLRLLDGCIPQSSPDLLVPVYSCPVPNLCIRNFTLLGDAEYHTVTLDLRKVNSSVQCQVGFRSGPRGANYTLLEGEFTAHNGQQIKEGIDRILKRQHKRWVVVCRKSGRWGQR